MPSQSKRQRFRRVLRVRTPQELSDAVARAADEQLTTPSEYIRQAVIARLRSDGIDLGLLRAEGAQQGAAA
jgi:hypothetical protein